MQRLLCIGQGFENLGPGLGELLLLLVGPRPGDGASQPGDFEECPADLEDVAELGRPPQEGVRGLTADAPPGKNVLTQFGQGRHAVVDRDHAAPREQPNGKLCQVLRRVKCAFGRVGHPLHDLRGVGRPVEQHRCGHERGTLEKMATARAAGAVPVPWSAEPARPPALSAPAAAETGTAKAAETGAAKAAEAGPAEAGSTEATEESTTRHRCRSFPNSKSDYQAP